VNIWLTDRAILIWAGRLTNTAVAGVGHQIQPFTEITYFTHKIVQFSVCSAEKAYQTVLEVQYSWWRMWTLKVMENFWLRTSLHLCKEQLVIAMECFQPNCFQPNFSPVTFLNTVLDINIHFQYGVISNSWPGYFGVQRSLLPYSPNINQSNCVCGAVIKTMATVLVVPTTISVSKFWKGAC
jgi:hypothetical protein